MRCPECRGWLHRDTQGRAAVIIFSVTNISQGGYCDQHQGDILRIGSEGLDMIDL